MASTNGSRRGNLPRPGAETLELLADPLNTTILGELSESPKRLAELRHRIDAAPQTTVRARLKGLEEAELVTLQPREGSAQVVEWTLTDTGRDLLVVMDAVERWLQTSPDGPLGLGSNAAKMAVKALVDSWSSTILCLLAAGPMSLTELAECVSGISYPSLERRLSAMRLVGQLQAASPNRRKGTPYEVTDWVRQGVGPLAATMRWEYAHRQDRTVPLSRSDTEAGFLLALPLLRVEGDLSGTCQLGVEVEDDEGRHCGATASVERGRVVFCSAGLENDGDSWATGSASEWAYAMLEASTNPLELHGNRRLARGLVEALNGTLFGGGRPSAVTH
jgi:DNA-binding HxlR family transcriptional regulator